MRDVARPMVAFLLTFAALTFAPLALIVCFFLLSQFWSFRFGNYAFWAALGAFIICVQAARILLKYADNLLIAPDDPNAPVAPRDEYTHDWREYSDQIGRYKRWAYYRRTRQFDKLAALEQEERELAAKAKGRERNGAATGSTAVAARPVDNRSPAVSRRPPERPS